MMNEKQNFKRTTARLAVSVCTIFALTGCSSNNSENTVSNNTEVNSIKTTASVTPTISIISNGIYSSTDLFTTRDITQSVDLTNATTYTVSDSTDLHISNDNNLFQLKYQLNQIVLLLLLKH